GILCADACDAAGLELSTLTDSTRERLLEVLPAEASVENPVDMLGSASEESYRRALPILLDDPGIDSVIVLFVPVVGVEEAAVATVVARAARDTDKTVLCSGLASAAPLPSFSYPEAAARALGRAAERGDWLHRPAGVVPELAVDLAAAAAIVDA